MKSTVSKNISTSFELGAGKSEYFSDLYTELSNEIVLIGMRQASRNGLTCEFLNFKTIVGNPLGRCVGGNERDINVLFLLAEAMWIFTGKKDVEFLSIFNGKIKDFSDDGVNFYAPYGYRLRHHGVNSMDKPTEENKHSFGGFDQLEKALEMLAVNPDDRRVVLSIWNTDLDLGTQSKDLPCNDMLMFKVRNGKLYQTIQNRSNDLHWGLPTNVFQFSFLGEIMSKILNLKLGEQVHNSQSLHAYFDNALTYKMHHNYKELKEGGLYDMTTYSEMDLNFSLESTKARLSQVTVMFNSIINQLLLEKKGTCSKDDSSFVDYLKTRSLYFTVVYELLKVYVRYTNTPRTQEDRLSALSSLLEIRRKYHNTCEDYLLLAMNFFVARLDTDDKEILMNGVFNSQVTKMLGKL